MKNDDMLKVLKGKNYLMSSEGKDRFSSVKNENKNISKSFFKNERQINEKPKVQKISFVRKGKTVNRNISEIDRKRS